jgi:outer membrane receptor for ferric coprogen and ferric-rhodotorulic acid
MPIDAQRATACTMGRLICAQDSADCHVPMNPTRFSQVLLLSIGLPAGLAAAAAPATPPKTTLASAEGEVIALPEFSVAGGPDEGWAASSSLSGTRTNVAIQDLPRSVQVLTSEFLADIGADTMSDAAAFMTGVTSQGKQDAVFDNNTLTVRGMLPAASWTAVISVMASARSMAHALGWALAHARRRSSSGTGT